MEALLDHLCHQHRLDLPLALPAQSLCLEQDSNVSCQQKLIPTRGLCCCSSSSSLLAGIESVCQTTTVTVPPWVCSQGSLFCPM